MLNKAILMGRLTADPELRTTTNGTYVTAFSIACQRSFAPKGQERQADFIDIVAWRQTAEFVSRYFRKGSMIAVEGMIQTRTYEDKYGNKRKAVEVVADQVHFAESKSKSPDVTASHGDFTTGNSFSIGDFGEFEEIEDDGLLPF